MIDMRDGRCALGELMGLGCRLGIPRQSKYCNAA